MYKIGLVITAKAAGRDLLRQLIFRKVSLLESNITEKSLKVIYNNIENDTGRPLPFFHVIHLRFAKLSRRELYSQMRFLSTHSLLFTRMALVVCEVDAVLNIDYWELAQLLDQKCQHRINMDYFLVLCNKSVDDIHELVGEASFLCLSASDYFNHLGEQGRYVQVIVSKEPRQSLHCE